MRTATGIDFWLSQTMGDLVEWLDVVNELTPEDQQ